jgi:hypothetical protein
MFLENEYQLKDTLAGSSLFFFRRTVYDGDVCFPPTMSCYIILICVISDQAWSQFVPKFGDPPFQIQNLGYVFS